MWYEMARHRTGPSSLLKDKTQISKHDKQRGRHDPGKQNNALIELFNLFFNNNRPNYKNRTYSNYQTRFSENDVKPGRLQITEGKSDSSSFNKPYFKPYSKESAKEKDGSRDKEKGKQHAYVAEEKNDNVEIDYYDSEIEYKDGKDNAEESAIEEPSVNLIEPDETSEVLHSLPHISRSHRCRMCKTVFDSNNKLHRHVREECTNPIRSRTDMKVTPPSTGQKARLTTRKRSQFSGAAMNAIVIDSPVDSNKDIGTGFGFREWKYVITKISL